MTDEPVLTALMDAGFEIDPTLFDKNQAPERYPHGIENLPSEWQLLYPDNPRRGPLLELARRASRRLPRPVAPG